MNSYQVLVSRDKEEFYHFCYAPNKTKARAIALKNCKRARVITIEQVG